MKTNVFLYYECGCCGHYHPMDSTGDCRDDAERFTVDSLEEKHGPTIWARVLDLDAQMEAE